MAPPPPPPHKTVVLDVVGLTRSLLTPDDTPFLNAYFDGGDGGGLCDGSVRDIEPAFPALTCTAQATYLTGEPPGAHGIVGNGWYDREYCEVRNWHQSARLVQRPRIWHALKERHPDATVFVNGWWHGMHDESIDYFINIRPQYLHDGGKRPDIYTRPAALRETIKSRCGNFPLHRFWGPLTSIEGSRYLAETSKFVDGLYDPTLTLVYLPHLDYSLQKYGPDDKLHVPRDLREIDSLLADLTGYYESRGARVIILSEYGISPVHTPLYPNRLLRAERMLAVRTECGGETLDAGSSRAFAVCDHAVAHVYVRDPADVPAVKEILTKETGVAHVLTANELDAYYSHTLGHSAGISSRSGGGGGGGGDSGGSGGDGGCGGRGPSGAHHAGRSGTLTCVAAPGYWFAYYYWDHEEMAPDFARCVAIHKKPGYDPAEMLWRFPYPWGMFWLIWKLVLSALIGIRTLVDATPLDCASIRGSHGAPPDSSNYRPVIMSRRKIFTAVETANSSAETPILAEEVYAVLWDSLVGE